MPVFRTEKVNDYAVIAKHHLRNKTLSYKAKGLMTFMLSVPPEWDFSLAGLAILASDGIDGVRSGIRELEKYGYLSRKRIRDVAGKLGDVEYTIHEIPKTSSGGKPPDTPRELPSKNSLPASDSHIAQNPVLEKPTLENPILDVPTSGIPTLENPTLGKPILALPTQANPMEISNKELSINGLSINQSNNKITNPSQVLVSDKATGESHESSNGESGRISQQLPGDSQQLSLNTAAPIDKPYNTDPQNQQVERLTVKTAQGAEKSADHAMTLVEQRFEQFWKAYPRKASKKAAKEIWLRINPDDTLFSTIMTALENAKTLWQSQGTALKHIPHPATWLDEERWEDELPSMSDNPSSLADAGSMSNHIQNYNHKTTNGNRVDRNRTGGAQNAANSTGYTIGGDNDPYRSIMSGQ